MEHWNAGRERRSRGSWPEEELRPVSPYAVGTRFSHARFPASNPEGKALAPALPTLGLPRRTGPMLRQRQIQVKPPHGERQGKRGAAFGRNQDHHYRKKQREAKKGEEMVAHSSSFFRLLSFLSALSSFFLSASLAKRTRCCAFAVQSRSMTLPAMTSLSCGSFLAVAYPL